MDYLYDGSFEGFLSCVYHHYYDDKASGIFPINCYQNNILKPYRIVETDEGYAQKVYNAIDSKISTSALKRVYYVFLSNCERKENIALDYIQLGFKLGCGLDALHGHPVVYEAQRIAQKVSFEAHRLTGLVRFSVLVLNTSLPQSDCENAIIRYKSGVSDELLYAKIEPDHDVLELMADHFADRFKGNPFLIHDARRKKALYSAAGHWYIAPINEKDLPAQSQEERFYRLMWKNYFNGISIEARVNPQCQKRMMPVRYWKNLTEMTLI